jgi:hypothetical protein
MAENTESERLLRALLKEQKKTNLLLLALLGDKAAKAAVEAEQKMLAAARVPLAKVK